jgi:GT2 family glycosyltransferase
MKKVAIIITTYNQDKLLNECLNSLINKTSYKNYKIFLIDDASKIEIGEKIKKKFKKISVTINKKNFGYAGANNIGIKKAIKEYDPDYFLLLNDDTKIISKNWLSEMVKVGEINEKIGILGCRIINPDGSLQNVGGHIQKWNVSRISLPKKNKVIDVEHIMGACFLMKKEVVKNIGYLDEIFSP